MNIDIENLVEKILLKRKYQCSSDEDLEALISSKYDPSPDYSIIKIDDRPWKFYASKKFSWKSDCQSEFEAVYINLIKHNCLVNTKSGIKKSTKYKFIYEIYWRNMS